MTVVTLVRKIAQPIKKQYFFLLIFWALLERAIWHIWQPIRFSQGSVLRFPWYFFEGVCDFVCGEVAWFLCVERLWDFFHSVTQAAWFIFSGVCLIYFLRRDCVIFWSDFFCGELAWFHLLRGCVILCVERLCDFSHSLTQVAWFIFLEVMWFFLRRGCTIFFMRDCVISLCEEVGRFFVWKGYF